MKHQRASLSARFRAALCKTIFFGGISYLVESASAVVYRGKEYAWERTSQYEKGYAIEFSNDEEFCTSWVMLRGINLYPDWVLGLFSLLALLYTFLGMSLLSDYMLDAIDQITSVKKTLRIKDENGLYKDENVNCWNPTIANFTLLALASSAPEIFLVLIETLKNLGGTHTYMGPSALLGSAAVHTLVWAIAVLSYSSDDVSTAKNIEQYKVYWVAVFFAFLAFLWTFITIRLWTPDEVSIAEAIVTLCLLLLFILSVYVADTLVKRARIVDEQMLMSPLEGKQLFTVEDFNYVLDMEKSKKLGGLDNYDDEMGAQQYLQQVFRTEMLSTISPEDIEDHLNKNEFLPRIFFRKKVHSILSGQVKIIKKKFVRSETLEQRRRKMKNNPRVGFRAKEYSVAENAGSVQIGIFKKRDNDQFRVGVRTVPDTATEGEDYVHIDREVRFEANETEHVVEVEIIDDEQWEPDEDFMVELYDLETKKRLDG